MPEIRTSSYESLNEKVCRPLMVGSSGGAGHNTAIMGIHGFLQAKGVEMLTHVRRTHENQMRDPRVADTLILKGGAIMNSFLLVRQTAKFFGFPSLPSRAIIEAEIAKLKSLQTDFPYIDMLLDVYPAGYESAALWNHFQLNAKSTELKKIIACQKQNDATHYQVVYDHFLAYLKKAEENKQPYTELISTQALGLSALCDAVKDYNAWLKARVSDSPPVIIQQYMTDLPSPSAIHFFNGLQRLTSEQQKQINLYGVDLKQDVIDHFFSHGANFRGIYNIPADQNPMIRSGFTDSTLDNSQNFDKKINLTLDSVNNAIDIQANEQIAAIMLGSQSTVDTISYIEPLLKQGMNKVFVLGGMKKEIKEKIDLLIQNNKDYKERIIPLANQSDKAIASLFSRSNVLVVKGGGLTIMEQKAMQHHPTQSVFIHEGSGIAWEEANAALFIQDMDTLNIHANYISPTNAEDTIALALLGSWIKRCKPDTFGIQRYLQNLDSPSRKTYLQSFTIINPQIPEKLDDHIRQCQKKDPEVLFALQTMGREYLKALKPDRTCYPDIKQLFDVLTDTSIDPSKRLDHFNLQYKFLLKKPSFDYTNDSFLRMLIRKIRQLLHYIFPSVQLDIRERLKTDVPRKLRYC